MPVQSAQTIVSDTNSVLLFEFNNGATIELLSETELSIDLWQQKDVKIPVANFGNGKFRVVKAGTPQSIYIIQNDQLRWLESGYQPSSNTIKPNNSPLKVNLSGTKISNEPNNMANDIELLDEEIEPLTHDQEIAKSLKRQQGKIKSCQAKALRDNTPSKGQIILGLNIEPTGKINSITVLNSSLRKSSLERCVVKVIERTRFAQFKGASVFKTYPIFFE